jgi:folate-binding protein YgfZ
MAVQAPPEVESDYRLLRERAGAVERTRRVTNLSGRDAIEFLQGQVTNDVSALESGEGCYALLLNPKGRILADLRILIRAPEEVVLESEPQAMETLLSELTRYKIGRQVQLSPGAEEFAVISLIGPAASAAAGREPPSREHAFIETQIGGADVLAVATDLGLDLVYPTAAAEQVRESLAPTPFVGENVAEILRIESGRPRFNLDMGPDNLPGELGLEERAISFTKGCYVGQEPVARMHHRGHPNRQLRGLRLSEPGSPGEPVTKKEDDAGKEVGKIGSTCVSPAYGPIALALLRREIEPGADVQVADKTTAQVVALPFGTR